MDTKFVLAMMVLLGVSLQVRAEDPNPLDTVVNSAKDKKFTGSPITLKLKDADINEEMRLIG
jgi:hypothetical protein